MNFKRVILLVAAMSLLLLVVSVPVFAKRGQTPPDTTKKGQAAAPETLDRSITGPGTPKIFLPDSLFDFGKSPQHQSLTHVFKVKNIGDAPLKVLKATGG